MPSKAALRNHYLTLRSAKRPNDVRHASEQIYQRLIEDPQVKKAGSVHVYLSALSKNEIDTFEFIRWCWHHHKAVFVPFVTPRNIMMHCRLTSLDNLKTGRFGIPEPDPVEPHTDKTLQVDLVVVPGLAFDRQGYRVGYGKGFYDKFLATRPEWVHTIGLCYNTNLVKEIPHEAHDQRVKALVCENQIIWD